MKVVSPFAKSYAHMTPAALFRLAEKEKMREYGDRIREVEHADFNPMVFTCTGGMAPQCQVVVKNLAVRLAEKKGLSVSVVAGWLRCRLSFALLRSTLVCGAMLRTISSSPSASLTLIINVALRFPQCLCLCVVVSVL